MPRHQTPAVVVCEKGVSEGGKFTHYRCRGWDAGCQALGTGGEPTSEEGVKQGRSQMGGVDPPHFAQARGAVGQELADCDGVDRPSGSEVDR